MFLFAFPFFLLPLSFPLLPSSGPTLIVTPDPLIGECPLSDFISRDDSLSPNIINLLPPTRYHHHTETE